MTGIKFSPVLPLGDANGAVTVADQLVRDPHTCRVLIALVDGKQVVRDEDTGAITVTARFRRIEAVLPADMNAAERLVRRSLEQRTGETVLPLDLEDEIREVFAAAAASDDEAEDDGDA